jgi:hypothetical protein
MTPISSRTGTWCALAASFLISSTLACKQSSRTNRAIAHSQSGAGAGRSQQSGEPVIEFDTRIHDYGVVNEGDTLEHTFQIRNKGTVPLELSSALSSCGCTAALLNATSIPPGGKTALDTTTDTHGDHGPVTRTITVFSNAPKESAAVLEIRYEADRLLGLDRAFVQLKANRHKRRTETIWVTGRLVAKARLRLVEVLGTDLVTARTIESREGGQLRKGLRLDLYGKSRASGEGRLTVATGLANPPALSLRFSYAVD